MKVAIVGYGYWGSKHARVLATQPDVELTIVDQDLDRVRHAATAHPNVRLATDLEEVDDVEAVVIATPSRSHARLALSAMARGCHVLVEKPMATSVSDCEDMIVAAEAADVVLMAGHTFEYHGAIWKLREIVQSGELGEIYYVDTARLNLGIYQPDVNVVWDLAPHDVSIVNYLLGRYPSGVTTWAQRHAGHAREDVAYLQLSYNDPALTAYIHVSWLDPFKVRRVTVVGSDKMAVCNDGVADEPIRVYDRAALRGEVDGMPVSYRFGDVVSIPVEYDEPLAVEDRTFLESIRSGTRPPTDGWNGLAVVRVLQAADDALLCRAEPSLAVPISASTHFSRMPAGRLVGNR